MLKSKQKIPKKKQKKEINLDKPSIYRFSIFNMIFQMKAGGKISAKCSQSQLCKKIFDIIKSKQESELYQHEIDFVERYQKNMDFFKDVVKNDLYQKSLL